MCEEMYSIFKDTVYTAQHHEKVRVEVSASERNILSVIWARKPTERFIELKLMKSSFKNEICN